MDGSRALTGPGEQPRDERSLEEIINEPYTADQIDYPEPSPAPDSGSNIPDPEVFTRPSTPMPDASRPGALSDPSNPNSPRIGEQVGTAPMPQMGSNLLAVSETYTEQREKETNMYAGQNSVLMINNEPNTVVAMSPQTQQPMGQSQMSSPSSYDIATKYAQMISSLTV